jgi:IS30 family transposase
MEIVKADEQQVHTITYDRSTEFADYEMVQNHTDLKVYFANVYSSFLCDFIENLNGVIPQ